ncbi:MULTISPECIES: formyltransferase family protein [Pirellulaceae]|uniref:Formyltetrahydrofolate deformylase n=1 Tax=Aporhodopirellula rubra TaxID=980271 RepID=A0A7W5H5W8_9BACT|nr:MULTISPECIES: formyltransferase family protein [Pirellulaceae]EMI46555.1 formyltetrahydrofolate deformylase [Rhodopirellula sp. SWK7]MBB3206678.1 formyltetrahydrofolate deformylase [Aporhodopirellula rubra]
MEVVITALGPDHTGLADPIIHHLTGRGARIAEIQMYDHDERSLFAMLCRIEFDDLPKGNGEVSLTKLQDEMRQIGEHTGLSIRAWSPDFRARRPRLAVACTYVEDTPRAVLQAVTDGVIGADVPVVISNRKKLAPLAAEFDTEFRMIGDGQGGADNAMLVATLDELDIDYLILARYMRVLPAEVCWQFAGGRIINLHHGLLPGFPGFRPYHDANNARMLTFGATCHFIIPELDAGNQTINQRTFSVAPGTPIEQIIAEGERDNEPKCLVEGVRRVVDQEVYLHFHRVVPRKQFRPE